MLKTLLHQVLKKSGVEKFDPTNEPFDPHKHYAVFQIPDGSKPDGTVAIVLKVLVQFVILQISLEFVYLKNG